MIIELNVDAIDPAGWNGASRKVVARLVVVVARRWFRLWWLVRVNDDLSPQRNGAEGDVRESSAAIDTFRQWCECARAMPMTSANSRRSDTHTVRQMPWLSASPLGRGNVLQTIFLSTQNDGSDGQHIFYYLPKTLLQWSAVYTKPEWWTSASKNSSTDLILGPGGLTPSLQHFF